MSAHLHGDWDGDEPDPEDIAVTLADLHHRLCEACEPEPLDLAERLARLVIGADMDTCLEVQERYVDILGPVGMAEFEALLSRPRRR
ncbi:MAG: hypothetical protein ACRDSQ_26465 [Actinokineospora sp.]